MLSYAQYWLMQVTGNCESVVMTLIVLYDQKPADSETLLGDKRCRLVCHLLYLSQEAVRLSILVIGSFSRVLAHPLLPALHGKKAQLSCSFVVTVIFK